VSYPRQLAALDPGVGQVAVEQAARLGAGFAVHQPQPAPGHVLQARDPVGQLRAQHQPFPPGAEPDHLAALAQQPGGRADVVFAVRPAQVRPGHVNEAGGGQLEGFPD
jgi:hypothetical protein